MAPWPARGRTGHDDEELDGDEPQHVHPASVLDGLGSLHSDEAGSRPGGCREPVGGGCRGGL